MAVPNWFTITSSRTFQWTVHHEGAPEWFLEEGESIVSRAIDYKVQYIDEQIALSPDGIQIETGVWVQSPTIPPSFKCWSDLMLPADPFRHFGHWSGVTRAHSKLSLDCLPEPVDIMASHGGLICAQSAAADRMYVCNPQTSRWRNLHSPPFALQDRRIVVLSLKKTLLDYELLMLNDGAANQISFASFDSAIERWKTATVNLDQPLHLRSALVIEQVVYFLTHAGDLLSLDLVGKSFNWHSLPLGEENWSLGGLVEIDGGLGLSLCYLEDGFCSVKLFASAGEQLMGEIQFELHNPLLLTLIELCPPFVLEVKLENLLVVVGSHLISYDSMRDEVKVFHFGDFLTHYHLYESKQMIAP